MKFTLYLFLLLALFLPSTIWGQDSLHIQTRIPNISIQQFAPTIAGASFAFTGAICNTSSKKWEVTQFYQEHSSAIDVIQYTPLVFPWAMKALGASTRSGWRRMGTSQALSTVIMAGTVSLMKDNISSLRPDGSDMRSFPSGHSAWAYMGATMTAYELGWQSPWYTLGAYSVASAVAMQRIIDRRHLPKDVITGAGIGILSAQIGYIIGDIIWKDKQIDNYFDDIKTPNKNVHSLSLINTYSIALNKFQFSDYTISIPQGFEAGLKWHSPIFNNISLATSISAQSAPLFMEKEGINKYIAPLNRLQIDLTPGYHFSINKIFNIDLEAGCTYNHNFSLKSQDKAISINKNSIGGIANFIASMRITDNFSIGANIGYEISPYSISITASDDYGINNHRISKTINSINLGISTSISL